MASTWMNTAASNTETKQNNRLVYGPSTTFGAAATGKPYISEALLCDTHNNDSEVVVVFDDKLMKHHIEYTEANGHNLYILKWEHNLFCSEIK